MSTVNLGDIEITGPGRFKAASKHALAVLVIALPIIIGLSLFSSYERFPHNDDWLYARSVHGWLEHGDYHHVTQHGELAASVAAHVAWGKLLHFGQPFSMKTLHFSQAIAAWLASCCVYVLAIRFGTSQCGAVLLAMVLSVCPLVYGHSFTFMTDITAMALVAMAVVCFHIAFRNLPDRVSQLWLVAGGVMAAFAFWCRQTHILCVAYPGVMLLLNVKDLGFRSVRRYAMLLIVLPLAAWLAFEWNLIVPGNSQRVGIVLPKNWDSERIRQIGIHLYGMCMLIGLLALPMFPYLVRTAFCYRPIGRICVAGWTTAVVALGLLGMFFGYGGRLFITQTTGYFLQNAHFGPVLLADAEIANMAQVVWSSWIWKTLSVGSILSFSVIVWWVVKLATTADPQIKRRVIAMSGFGAVSLLFMLAVVTAVMDRYWMILFIPCMFVIATALEQVRGVIVSRWWQGIGVVIGLGLFWMSLAMTHDFLAWNEQRGQQMHAWIERGIEDKHIDAGADLNGWLLSDHDPNTMQREGDETRSWRGYSQFAILHSDQAPTGWEKESERTWYSWATLSEQTMYLYRKLPADVKQP